MMIMSDVLADGIIDKLVREHLITNQMATSLINESATAMFIAQELVETSFLLYWQCECCSEEQSNAPADIAYSNSEHKIRNL